MNSKIQLLIALTMAAVLTLIIASGALQRFDKWTQDALLQRPGAPSGDIVIIGVDEKALEELGTWPWPRDVLADALMALASDPENKPAAVAIDVLFSGDSGSAASDEYLAQAAGYLGNVVTASFATYGEQIAWEDRRAVAVDASAIVKFEEPYPALRDATVQGHINAMPDRDGILRHALLYEEPEEGRRVYSMAFETARLYLESQGKTIGEPPLKGGHFYVPFTAGPGTYYDGYSVADLIAWRIDPSYWSGKIVMIGPYTAGLQDRYFTSVNRASQMYGVEYQANVIQCLLDGNYKKEAPDWPQALLLLLLCALAAVLYVRLKLWQGAAVCGGLILLGFGGPMILYRLGLVTHPLWLPVGALALFAVALLLRYIQAAEERQALALREERINAELSLATRIQANALPKTFPPFPDRKEFDIYASMTPAKEVGGDLYDFFLMDEDHLCLVIGDVSGKGVPASLFMMVALTLIHHVAMREKSPAKILEAVNREICSRNPEEMFVTVWLGVLEISTGKLTAANAGHEYPAVKKAYGHFELLKDRHGMVVGGIDMARYREYEIPMERGDKIFVYTDGVPEATDAAEAFYTTDRMISALRSGENGSPQEILGTVADSVRAFAGAAPQFDDLTMLCLEWKGPEADEPRFDWEKRQVE